MPHCHFHHNLHNLRHIERQMRLLDTRLHLLRDRLSSCRLHRLFPHHCHSHLSHCHSHHHLPHCHSHHHLHDCHSHHHLHDCHSHHHLPHCHSHLSHCHSHLPHCHSHLHDCHSHLHDCHHHCLGRRALAARLDLERRLNRLRRLGMMLSSCRSHSHLALCDAKCCDPCDPCVTVKDGKVTVSSEHKEEHDCLLGQSCHHTRCLKEFSLPPCDDEVTVVESNTVTVEAPDCCHDDHHHHHHHHHHDHHHHPHCDI